MIPTKKHTAHVPVSPTEIIEQVHEAYETGITIAHLHARDENGIPTYKKNVYRDIFEAVRKHCPGLVICGSSSGRNFSEFEKRSEVIELRPDMCSLTLSSLNFHEHASVNAPDMIIRLAEKMNEYGVKQELECFHSGMINYGKYLIMQQILKPPFYWNLIFGNTAGFQATPLQIGTAVSELNHPGNFIAFGGIGKSQLTATAFAIAAGYGVRTGLEDNIWFDKENNIKATNIGLLQRVHELMRIHHKQLMTAIEFGKSGFYNATTPARI